MKYTLIILLAILVSCSIVENESLNLQIKEIESGVYLHTSYKEVEGYGVVDSNGLVITNGDEAYIVDTPWSQKDTETLISWINEQGFEIKASISTHSHEDRTAGIAVLNSKLIPTYTSKLTHDLLVHHGKPTATNVFQKEEFVLKTGLIEVFYPGAGHTQDNVVVWLPENGILFGGCLVRSLGWDSLGYVGDASIESWSDSVRKLKSKYSSNITLVVPGHGKIGELNILDHTIQLADAALPHHLAR